MPWEIRLESEAAPPAYAEEIPWSWDRLLPLLATPLDAAARELGLRPLTEFVCDESELEREIEGEVLREHLGEDVDWRNIDPALPETIVPDAVRGRLSGRGPFYDPAEGLRTVQGLIAHLNSNPETVAGLKKRLTVDDVLRGLLKMENTLLYARGKERRFRITT